MDILERQTEELHAAVRSFPRPRRIGNVTGPWQTAVSTQARPAPPRLFEPTAGFIRPREARPFIADVQIENKNGNQVTLDYVDFRLLQPGGDTSIWSNKHQQAVTQITLSLNLKDRSSKISFTTPRLPTNAHEYLELLRIEQALSQPLVIRLIDRSLGIEILQMETNEGLLPPPDPEFMQVMADLDAIQHKLQRPILIAPGRYVGEQEQQTIGKLRAILHEGGFTTTWTDFTPDMPVAAARALLDDFSNGQRTQLQVPGEDKEILFGIELPLGPTRFTFHAKLDTPEELRTMIEQASGDETMIRVRFVPADEERVLRVDYLDWHPQQMVTVTVGPDVELTEIPSEATVNPEQQRRATAGTAETASPGSDMTAVESRNKGAIQLLRSWMEEDAAMSPEQQEAAEAEWERIKAGLAAHRLSDRPLFS